MLKGYDKEVFVKSREAFGTYLHGLRAIKSSNLAFLIISRDASTVMALVLDYFLIES